MAQSRYLFALSCYQMDLLNEAESALSPLNEPGAEVLCHLSYIALIFSHKLSVSVDLLCFI